MPLGLVERGIGCGEKLVESCCRPSGRHGTQPDADAEEIAFKRGQRKSADLRVHMFCNFQRVGLCCVGQDGQEFFTPVARDSICPGSEVLLDGLSHPFKTEVAMLVAKGVVDSLEVIDIDHQHCDPAPLLLSNLPKPVQRRVQVTAIENAG